MKPSMASVAPLRGPSWSLLPFHPRTRSRTQPQQQQHQPSRPFCSSRPTASSFAITSCSSSRDVLLYSSSLSSASYPRTSAVSTPPSSSTPSIPGPPLRSSPFTIQRRHQSTRKRMTKRLRIPAAPSHRFAVSPPEDSSSSSAVASNSDTIAAAAAATTAGDHIIFNPPSSQPSVYHTPFKFLPPLDPRRAIAKKLGGLSAAASTTMGLMEMRAAAAPSSSSAIAASATTSRRFAQLLSTSPNHPANATIDHVSALQSGTSDPKDENVQLPPPIEPVRTKKYHLGPADFERMRALRVEDSKRWTIRKLSEEFDCTDFFVRLVVKGLAPEARERASKATAEYWEKMGPRKREVVRARTERRRSWGIES